jgi:hypothetical protein
MTEMLNIAPESEFKHSYVVPAPRRMAIAAVRAYQAMRGTRPSPCRYFPSCSEYAAESLERHGLVKGTWLSARRLGRCRPLGGYGADPVPD